MPLKLLLLITHTPKNKIYVQGILHWVYLRSSNTATYNRAPQCAQHVPDVIEHRHSFCEKSNINILLILSVIGVHLIDAKYHPFKCFRVI